ncbi:EDD domain protein, DegV family [Anaerosporobacter mobilis DSM 15930]|jgi:DegV family protein with EDD domain|uniref:EDD domain protein, DegV family n=1 Tax=Anaerosporobacter mobilis DSM 15930 TaxID=1120996 RepID=A0A1M7LVR5_9FIRM|nr:DegV family protein [Anaerosporobacter mobilis]SHM82440.1 EDD domain protein, DegV family [Anaerosporobacter mobilis DSM 15930]
MGYVIISDGGCDLEQKYLLDNNLVIVPCYVSFDGNTYLRNYVDISVEEFYNKIKEENIFPRTSLPAVHDYYVVFEQLAKTGDKVLCICMTSNLSGSYQSAINAKDMILEKYQDAIIHIIDSRVNTVLQGLLIQECVRLKKSGMEIETLIQYIEGVKNTGRIYFAIGNMKLLSKGGRTQNLARLVNIKVGIKPVLMLRDGEHHFVGMTRNRQKSIIKLLDAVCDYFKNTKKSPKEYLWVVGYGLDIEEANILKEKLEEMLDIKSIVKIQRIGVIIASHTGPHPIGVAFMKKSDMLGGNNE